MKEQLSQFIAQNGGLVATILIVVVALNLLLSGISKALEVFKDKTATNIDNKIFDALAKVLSVLQKIVDWGSANRKAPSAEEKPKP